MFRIRLILWLSGFYLLSACTPALNISSDYDTNIDFSSLKNYRWHEPNNFNHSSVQYLADDITDQRIRTNVDQQLTKKGYHKLASGPVDFLVNYSVTVKDKASVRGYNSYNGYGSGFNYGGRVGTRGSGVSIGYSTGPSTTVNYYQQGTLVIDILDPKTDKLIWRGSANGRLPKEQNQQEREKMIKEAVSKILQRFPPEK